MVEIDSTARERTGLRAAVRIYRAELVLGLSLILYAVLAVLAHHYAYFQWDVELTRRIQSIQLPGFRMAMVGVSFLGTDWVPVGMVAITGLALILRRRNWEGIICMAGTGLGALVNRLLKMLSARPRPDDAIVQVVIQYPNESFPSGHVVLFVQFFGFLLFLSFVLLERGLPRVALFSLLGFLIVMVGFSRVYLGAHWPSDVLGAYLAAGIWLLLMIEYYRRRTTRRKTVQV